jgi:hypothetical protein
MTKFALKVLDRKQTSWVPLKEGMGVKFIATKVGETDKLVRIQEETRFVIRDISGEHHGRPIIHFTDGTWTSKPEGLEVWYDDLHAPKPKVEPIKRENTGTFPSGAKEPTFVDRFISRLRISTYDAGIWNRNGQLLADALEKRAREVRSDGFDLTITGDDEKDRDHLATWMEAREDDGAYCSPSFGRNFSAAIAWILRNRQEHHNPLLIDVALRAVNDEKYAKIVARRAETDAQREASK